MVPTGLKGTEAPWRGFHFPFPEARLPTRMETSSPGWGPRGPCTEKPPLGRDTGLGTLETQPGGAGPASGSSGLQVAAGLVLRSRPAASLAYSGPACFARAPRFRASRLGSSVPTPRVLPAKRVPVCPGMNTHTHVPAHTGTHVVRPKSSARVSLLPGTPAGGETTRPAGAGGGPRTCWLTGWTWSRPCSTAGRRSRGRTPRAGAPARTSGSGPRRRRLKASSPASASAQPPRRGPATTRGNPSQSRQACSAGRAAPQVTRTTWVVLFSQALSWPVPAKVAFPAFHAKHPPRNHSATRDNGSSVDWTPVLGSLIEADHSLSSSPIFSSRNLDRQTDRARRCKSPRHFGYVCIY